MSVLIAPVARLIEAVRAHRVDLVHARSRAPAWSAYYAARRTGAKFVTTFHGAYKARGELKRWYNGIMARGERVIAISEFIANHVVDHYGCDPARVRMIPRGVDLLRFDPQNVSAERVIQLAREKGQVVLPENEDAPIDHVIQLKDHRTSEIRDGVFRVLGAECWVLSAGC